MEFQSGPLPDLAVVEAQWRGLEETVRPSFFTSWHWIGALLAVLPRERRPRLLRGSIGGKTVALGLLGSQVTNRRYGLIRSRSLYLNEIGDPSFDLTTEHNGLLVEPAYADPALDALTKWFAEQWGDADELHIGGSMQPLPAPFVEGRGFTRRAITKPSFCIDLCHLMTSDGELYPVLSANSRQQLRRALRDVEQLGMLTLEVATTCNEALQFFAQLKQLHIAAWEQRGKQHSFSSNFFELFHQQLIERSFGDGVIKMVKVCAGASTIGILYNFQFGDYIYAYQSGFNYNHGKIRPGVVSHALAIRDAYRSGAAVYDFLAGRNRLKESFSTRCDPMLWQVVQQPRVKFRLEQLAQQVRDCIGKPRAATQEACCSQHLRRLPSDNAQATPTRRSHGSRHPH